MYTIYVRTNHINDSTDGIIFTTWIRFQSDGSAETLKIALAEYCNGSAEEHISRTAVVRRVAQRVLFFGYSSTNSRELPVGLRLAVCWRARARAGPAVSYRAAAASPFSPDRSINLRHRHDAFATAAPNFSHAVEHLHTHQGFPARGRF